MERREERTSNQQQIEREDVAKIPETSLMKMQKMKENTDKNDHEPERKKKRRVDYEDMTSAGNPTVQNKVRKSKITTN